MKFRILIADDDEDDLELYKEAANATNLPFEITGVHKCSNIFGAINDQALPNLVIIDGIMPNHSLEECIQMIDEDGRLNNIPLIVWSGSGNKSTMNNSYSAKVNLYLNKQSSFNAIEDVFKRLYYWDWTAKSHCTKEEFLGIKEA